MQIIYWHKFREDIKFLFSKMKDDLCNRIWVNISSSFYTVFCNIDKYKIKIYK